MGVQNWSEHVVLVSLPAEPQIAEDLADVTERVRNRHDCDVVIDCSDVERVGCSSCCRLLELNDAVRSSGHCLVLCGSGAKLQEAFAGPAFGHTLRFTNDRFTALAKLRLSGP